MRPKLIEAFNEIRQYGVGTDKLIDLHEQIAAADRPDQRHAGAGGSRTRRTGSSRAQALPADTEIAELITMLVRFRTQAVAAVTATLASSIESTIESLVSRVLADYVESSDLGELGPR